MLLSGFTRDLTVVSDDIASTGAGVTNAAESAVKDVLVGYGSFYIRAVRVEATGDPGEEVLIRFYNTATVGTAYNTTGFLRQVPVTLAATTSTFFGARYPLADFLFKDADNMDSIHYTAQIHASGASVDCHVEFEIEQDVNAY